MTKIYTIFISLNSAFSQLLNENNMQYFSIFLLSIGIILMICNFHKIKFSKRENLFIFFLMCAVLISVLISSDKFLSFRSGIRLLTPFLIFILFTTLMKNYNSFHFYLKTNVYVSIISVIIINYFYIIFLNQLPIEDPYRGFERTVGFFTGSAGWHGLAHFSLLTIFLISFYKPITSSRIEKYFLSFSFLIACYLILKSGTRTVYLGLITFMLIWFLLKKRYLWLMILVIGIYLLFLFNTNFHALLIEFDPHETNFEEMGSGRGGIWIGFIRLFFMQPWVNILFGTGTQLVYIENFGSTAMAGNRLDAHNDYLLILYQIGIFSLFIFLSFYFSLFIKAIRLIKSDVGKLYISMLASVALMNFASNAYISRIGVAMVFWPLFVPLFNKDILFQLIDGSDTCKV